MPELQQTLDVEAIADRARSLWRDAGARASTARVELYAKAAVRSRVTRDLDGVSAKFDRVFESGLALRAFASGRDHAGFAAASGLSNDAVRWAVDTACSFRAHASLSAPNSADIVAAERWDLDAAKSLPTEEALTRGLLERRHLEWIEAGTTVEVLIGAEGWLAARRRHRIWALDGGPSARLIAQRGITGWESLFDGLTDGASRSGESPTNLGALILTPVAAAPVVTALVDTFHGPASVPVTTSGAGWHVADEPIRADALAGGSFDDAGFPTVPRVLAADGVWVGSLEGAGCFRRASYREPPTEGATNLVMPPGTTESNSDRAWVVHRCRLLRPTVELWVMELDHIDPGKGGGLKRRWVRVQPQTLLAACTARVSKPIVTSAGPIVPALRFEGLPSS